MTRNRTEIIKEATKRIQDAILKRDKTESLNAELIKLTALLKSNEAVADTIVEALERTSENSRMSKEELLEAIRSIVIQAPNVDVPKAQVDVKVPEIKLPKIQMPEVRIPEIKLPTINVPEPKVTVNVPEIKVPKIEVPEVVVTMPEYMNVGLDRYTRETPLPVMQVDPKGNYVAPTQAVGGSGGNTEKTNQILREIRDTQGKFVDSPSVDAFGRVRTSEPFTIFDSKQLHDASPLFFDDQEVSGSGTSSAHSANEAATTMSVSATTAGKRVRQTFMRFNYQSGKSHEILVTFGEFDTSTGITKAVGYFDDNNGIFFKSDEGVVSVNQRSNVTGSPVDTSVTQSNWNLDKMDGTGKSGVTLDFTKTQIGFIDFEWLGVGRVRTGFVVDGMVYYVHEFNNANNLTTVYMSTPNLPIRYEIENDGTGAADDFVHICSSVQSEGGQEANGVLHHVDSGTTAALSSGTQYAILGGRLKSTHLDVAVIVENVSLAIVNTSGGKAHWEFIVGGSVAGTFTYADKANSAVQIAQGGATNTVTGGTDIDGGYVTDSASSRFSVPNALRLGSYIDGTPQEWQLVVTPLTNNITVQASVTWRELL